MESNQLNHLALRAVAGDARALETLIGEIQDWIYNVARGMALSPADAEDITQEVLIKVATNLARFDPDKGNLRTWSRRIAVNHVLNLRRLHCEELIDDFDGYGRELDRLGLDDMSRDERENPETRLLIEEARLGCMMGMLICLDREQRMVLILGELMGLSDRESAELLDISREAFRKRLERARRDLYNFMNDKCGLINTANPCRCAKKTRAFIREGWVNPDNIQFARPRLRKLREAVQSNVKILDEFCEAGYTDLWRDIPFHDTPAGVLDTFMEQLKGT